MRRARVSLQGLAALVLLALVGSCDNDTTGPYADEGPLLVVAELGAQLQNVTITRKGWGVTDGTVTVNGVVIPHTDTGHYHGQLATPVPAGSPLNLQVSAGGATVQATGTVPEAPILIAPATETVFDPGDSITVRWTSATNPERFVVSWRIVDDVIAWLLNTVVETTAPGTAREIGFPASKLPAGANLPISVVACNDGSFTGPVHTDSRMGICAQNTQKATITISTAAFPLRITGGMGAQRQNISIRQGGRDITDGVSGAVVTVNGVNIPHVGAGPYPVYDPGYYSGELPTPVPPGSPLHLRVNVRGLMVEATGNVPEVPALTAPVTGTAFSFADSITVRWTSAASPDRFVVSMNRNGPSWNWELPGTARELGIAATDLPVGADFTISVVAYNDGSFSGPAHSDSRMGIMSVSNRRVITIDNP